MSMKITELLQRAATLFIKAGSGFLWSGPVPRHPGKQKQDFHKTCLQRETCWRAGLTGKPLYTSAAWILFLSTLQTLDTFYFQIQCKFNVI